MSPNWWMTGTFHIRNVLINYIDAYNSTASKKLPFFVHVKVAVALKAKGLFSSNTTPTDDQIIEAFKKYIILHEEEKVEPIINKIESLISDLSDDKVKVDPVINKIESLLSDLRDDEEIIIYRRSRNSCCCGWW
jgi:hypothetical protein